MKRSHSLLLMLLGCGLLTTSSIMAMDGNNGDDKKPGKRSASANDNIDDITVLLAERHRAHLQRMQQEQQIQTPVQVQAPVQVQTPVQTHDTADQQEQERRNAHTKKYAEFLAQQLAEQEKQQAEQKQKEEQTRFAQEQRVKNAALDIDAVLAHVTEFVFGEKLKRMKNISDSTLEMLTQLLNTLRTLHDNKEVTTLLAEKNSAITELINNLKQAVMQLMAQVNQNTRFKMPIGQDEKRQFEDKRKQFEDLCNQISKVGGDGSPVDVAKDIEPYTADDYITAEQVNHDLMQKQVAADEALAKQLNQQSGKRSPSTATSTSTSTTTVSMPQPHHNIGTQQQDNTMDADLLRALELSRQEQGQEYDTKPTTSSSSTTSTSSVETDEEVARRLQAEYDQQATIHAPSTRTVTNNNSSSSTTTGANNSSTATVPVAPKTDEQIAQELQEEEYRQQITINAPSTSTATTNNTTTTTAPTTTNSSGSQPGSTSTTTTTTSSSSSVFGNIWNWFKKK